MNQILNIINKNKRVKLIFKIQFFISASFIVIGIIYLVKDFKRKEKENSITKTISINAKLNIAFSENIYEENENIYFGQIICEKIKLNSFIYNKYSLDNLKVLPCKFSGGELGEAGNICIIGHNYFDDRFFSNLDQLELGDEIILKNLENKSYQYEVYKKYEIFENDTEKALNQDVERELTLCTCTHNKEKRLIIKAKNIS